MKLAMFAFATALAFAPVALFAQTISNRKENQQDRMTLNHQQNVESKRIYRTKHDIGHR